MANDPQEGVPLVNRSTKSQNRGSLPLGHGHICVNVERRLQGLAILPSGSRPGGGAACLFVNLTPQTLVLGIFQGSRVGLTSEALPFLPFLQLVGSQQNTSLEAFSNLGRAVVKALPQQPFVKHHKHVNRAKETLPQP